MSTVRRSTKIACSERKTSLRIRSLLPRHVTQSNSEITPILEAYYRWMEQEGNVLDESYCVIENTKTQNATPEFLNILQEKFLSHLPRDVEVDKKFLIQNVVDLYRKKGTEDGIKLFFRIVYGSEPTVTYPSESILRASDGIWSEPVIIRVEYIGEDYRDLIGKRIFGRETNAWSIVESAQQEQVGSITVTTLTVSQTVGTFNPDEIVQTLEAEEMYTARVIGIVQNYRIVDGGSGYQQGESIPIQDLGDGIDFQAVVSSVDIDGQITEITFTNTGANYNEQQPTINYSAMTGTGADIRLFVGQQYKSPGEFITERGMLSASPRLQDGKVYQEFSYIIKSNIPYSDYIDQLKQLVHPAGFNVTGIFSTAIDPDNGAYGPMLFHLSDPRDAVNGTLNFSDPNHPSTSKFIEHKINIDTAPMKALDYIKRYGLDGEGVLNDQSQVLGDYLDQPLQKYLNIKMKDAYIPGIEAFELHDTFQDITIQTNPYIQRFDEEQIDIYNIPITSEIQWHLDQEQGEWYVLEHREKHVYTQHRLIQDQGIELLGGGSIELMGGGTLDPIGA